MRASVPTPSQLGDELKQARLPDRRLKRRLGLLVESVAESPSSTLPTLCQTDAELEGAYRFLSNPRVQWRHVLAPHFQASAVRAKTAKALVVVHDSSMFHFGGKRQGLGRLDQSDGFLGHFSLSVDVDRLPFGLLSAEVIIRRAPNKAAPARRTKESQRWWRNIVASQRRLGAEGHRAIHAADREAASFEILSKMKRSGFRFVIRTQGNKLVDVPSLTDGTQLKMDECMAHREGRAFREVPLSARENRHAILAKTFPSRDARMASLRIRATQVTLRRPATAPPLAPETLNLNLVEVFEPQPPTGEEPIQWLLLTTEDIKSLEQLTAIVDIYRARWTIEEYFKALKTGCSYQERQLESAHALLNTLAVLAPVAWRLLLLRTVARTTPTAPATRLFSNDELSLLRTLSRRVALSDEPTIHQALLAIAGIGGHLKRNGDPGWLTLSRGYSTFLTAQLGWLAARRDSLNARSEM